MSSPLVRPSLRDASEHPLYHAISCSLLIHVIVAWALMMFSAGEARHVKQPRSSYTVHLGKIETNRRPSAPVEKTKPAKPHLKRKTASDMQEKPSPLKRPSKAVVPPEASLDLLALKRQSDSMLAGMPTGRADVRRVPAHTEKPVLDVAPPKQTIIENTSTPPSMPVPSAPKAAPESKQGKVLAPDKSRVDLNRELEYAQRELSRLQELSPHTETAPIPSPARPEKRASPKQVDARRPQNPPEVLAKPTTANKPVEVGHPETPASESDMLPTPPIIETAIPEKDPPQPLDPAPNQTVATISDAVPLHQEKEDILVRARDFSQTISSLLEQQVVARQGDQSAKSADDSDTVHPELVSVEPLLSRDIKIEVLSSSLDGMNIQLYRTIKVTAKGVSTYDASRRDGALLETEAHEKTDDNGSPTHKFLVVTKAEEGAYCLVIENKEERTLTVDIVFRLYEGKDSQQIREYRQITLSPRSAQRFSFLMPYTVFWDDDSYFSGKMEDLRTITKFNYDSGIVWKRGKR